LKRNKIIVTHDKEGLEAGELPDSVAGTGARRMETGPLPDPLPPTPNMSVLCISVISYLVRMSVRWRTIVKGISKDISPNVGATYSLY
jgi:hypothetical protein